MRAMPTESRDNHCYRLLITKQCPGNQSLQSHTRRATGWIPFMEPTSAMNLGMSKTQLHLVDLCAPAWTSADAAPRL
eukprot:CAMPEP_0204274148 /NCGR_PEP_ID=MMETSP0468-20130131/25022_1 /ASSEMBLY_ACC=CAM_ASM_000383 /TAXON_ID=2969 /ORGANISM="Oxyrrhis marina" /LENGTH=76 /DNA_ID=CAMNT_0051250317 /DNA_START=744 /DNA_END=974 /DNA_ORIENTATION=+